MGGKTSVSRKYIGFDGFVVYADKTGRVAAVFAGNTTEAGYVDEVCNDLQEQVGPQIASRQECSE